MVKFYIFLTKGVHVLGTKRTLTYAPNTPSNFAYTYRASCRFQLEIIKGVAWKEVSLVYKLLAFGGLYHRNKELYKFLSLSSNAIFVQYMFLVWSMGARRGGVHVSVLYNSNVGARPLHATPPSSPPTPSPLFLDLKKFIKICEGTLELLAYSKLDIFLSSKRSLKG